MRVAFAGTPLFAEASLAALLAGGHEVVLVLTQPDRPSGRGQKLAASPVKRTAQAHGIPLCQPEGLRLDGRFGPAAAAAHAALSEASVELLVVAAYGLILPASFLALPKEGCVNVHASLLPRWRGAAPIARALEAGDIRTGITIMLMDQGLDTGPMLLRREEAIMPADTAGDLEARLAALGGETLLEALGRWQELVPVPQPEAGATYAPKLKKEEGMLDFRADAGLLARRVRAFNPQPGCFFQHGETALKCWRAAVRSGTPEALVPGTVISADSDGLAIACGADTLVMTELQRPGGRALPAGPFLAGYPIRAGTLLG